MAGLRQSRKVYKASGHLREHIARFNKSSPDMVKIDPKLNEFVMSRVVKSGGRVKVEISKTGDVINAKLAPGQVPVSPTQESAKTPAQAKHPQASTPTPKEQQKQDASKRPKAEKTQNQVKAESKADKKSNKEPAEPAQQKK